MDPAPIFAFRMTVKHSFIEYFDFAEVAFEKGIKGESDRPTLKKEAGDGESKTP